MANVVHPPVDFYPRPVNHSPSPFGFGFGLSNSSTMVAARPSPTTPGHVHSAAFHQLSSSISQANHLRAHKRRHEPDDDGADSGRASRDDAMDRSPTPERPKKITSKRARVLAADGNAKEGKMGKENQHPVNNDDDVDVGVLLASLPPQSLLPLLTSLLNAQPSLKPTILSLIPRPTLETALHALSLSAKKLRDAYPYSNNTSFSHGDAFPISSAGFGRPLPPFGHGASNHNTNNGGMRESYIISRLRPHIGEFVAACMSYLPYFSYMTQMAAPSNVTQSNSTGIQSQYKEKSHPSETFLFLSALTNHLFSQPPLTQASVAPQLFPRLLDEWKAWVHRVDEMVNQQGGMFGSETVQGWERDLDKFAEHKIPEAGHVMREIRDMWVAKVGWLVGRHEHHAMEEEEL